MAVKSFRPQTPSMRHLKQIDRSDLWAGRPLKSLTTKLQAHAGRNSKGHITVRRRSGGHKKLYRLLDFKRNHFDVSAIVERIEYDPNRTAFIALIKYEDGTNSYILAPSDLVVGATVISSRSGADIKPANAMPLKLIPIGTNVHNIEQNVGAGGAVARAAGGYAQIVGKDSGYALLRIRSGEIKMFPLDAMASIGVLSNIDKKNTTIGKAGRARWLGKRPAVRGVAMNPVDHPHGGGEGKTSGGRHPVSPWGKSAKGKRTRSRKKSTRLIARSRHAK